MAEWLHVHLPALQLDSRYAQQQPAVLFNQADRTVLAATRAAEQLGIEPGMSLSAAFMLAEELALQAFHQTSQQQWLERIALLGYRLCGNVLVHEQGISLRIDDVRQLYRGNIKPMWQPFALWLQQYQLRFQSIRVQTPLQGLLLAPTQPLNKAPILSSEQAAKLLQQLPLTQCQLPPRTLDKLEHSGLQRLGELLALPTGSVQRRFGKWLQQWLQDLRHARPNEQAWFSPKKQFRERIELNREAQSAAAIKFPIRPLLDTLETWLASQKLCATGLAITLLNRQRERIQQLTIHASTSLIKAEEWLPLIDLQLERCQLNEPALYIEFSALGVSAQSRATEDLFEQASGMRPAQLLDLLSAKLGNEAVQHFTGEADPRPERACQVAQHGMAQLPTQHATAFWLVPIQSTHIEQWQLLHHSQRIHTGWWELESSKRDYYFAQHQDGRFGWLFRDAQGEWFLQGYVG
ncbi:Y-family DNA polymerase [Salinibius halmophilus]|uniref:Y-family DNA polymerase n=1 Tax=Salinibius halmophilus TaxID=1853216 RepID=UPI000E663EB5|nr:DNA polymerase Y family protein [Salinibius halmophilus]